MGNKRKRDSPLAGRATKKSKKRTQHQLVAAQNQFAGLPLSADSGSDSEVLFDHEKRRLSDEELVLVDSDNDASADEGVVIVSDSEGEQSQGVVLHEEEGEEVEQRDKKVFIPNELSKNEDFIEFGFSSSDEGAEDEFAYSDDGVISDDQHGNVHSPHSGTRSAYPWIKDHDHSKQKEIADWLTMEMKDFVNYISPSKAEIVTRNTVVSRLKKEVSQFWPGTETHVFGSCATDLYLPGSDIDIVIISVTGDYENRSRLYQLSSFLRTRNLAKNIEVIAKAKVPIIKFVDPLSNIHIDISFERENGIIAARRIRKWLAASPGLRELVLIVKQFLRSRKLNNVHVGGLGGYSTIILCYHFLKMHPRLSTGSMSVLDNLGSLLIEFFELYGRNFSYDDLIIAIDPETDLPVYLLKTRHPELNSSRNPFSIVIQDPSDPENNISRSSYNLRDLKKAFGGAYQLLVDKCYSLNEASYKNRIGLSILGDIIRFNGKERDFNDDRDKVINNALVNHESEDESEGINGNDKYYFSDITVESDEEELRPNKVPVTEKPQAPAADHGKKVSDFMSIKDSESEEEAERVASLPKKPVLDKDVKRDYWRQKGLDL